MVQFNKEIEKADTIDLGLGRRRSRPFLRLSRRRLRGPAIVLCVGLALTFVVFLIVRWREVTANRVQSVRNARQLSRPIEQEVRLTLEFLYTLPPFFESSVSVTRKEFRTFVARALKRHSALLGVNWIPLVKHSQREEFENQARSEGISDYEFRDLDVDTGSLVKAPSRPEYLPIYYMEPRRPALGLDLLARPLGQDLLDARHEIRAVVSNRISNLSKPEGDYLVAVAHSVFRPGTEHPEFLGFVAVVFRVYPLITELLSLAADRMHVLLIDDSAPVGEQVVFASSPDAEAVVARSDFAWQTEIAVADRLWRLRIVPATAPAAGVLSWVAFGLGCGLSVLLSVGIVFVSTLRALRKQVEAALELGPYTLEAKIGQGGMGEVWRARHALLRRPTAVKIVRKDILDVDSLERFEREVHATSSLTHPNTVAIYDYGQTKDGMFYYAMEFLAGLTLAELVKSFGPQPCARVIHFLLQVCGALHEAHSRDIIHRDIKPENLILCERGAVYDVVKVVDFGLAKFLRRTDVAATGKNVILGTPLYLAPEALSSSDKVGPPSDLYSLGAVGYYLLTGVPPFSGANVVEISMKVLNEKPERPSQKRGVEVPADLEDVVLSCLAPEPERRPASTRLLQRKLESCRDAGKWTQAEAEAWLREHGSRARE